MDHCDKDAMGIIVGLFSKDNVQVRFSDLLSNSSFGIVSLSGGKSLVIC